jgi:hypothetical protein
LFQWDDERKTIWRYNNGNWEVVNKNIAKLSEQNEQFSALKSSEKKINPNRKSIAIYEREIEVIPKTIEINGNIAITYDYKVIA